LLIALIAISALYCENINGSVSLREISQQL